MKIGEDIYYQWLIEVIRVSTGVDSSYQVKTGEGGIIVLRLHLVIKQLK